MQRNVSVILRSNTNHERGCAVVLGVPRGGTSVVSGICHIIGFQMGLNIDPSNMECLEVIRMNKEENFQVKFSGYIKKCERNNLQFGFKDPTAIDWLGQVVDLIPNPIFIYVSRDIVASAERERLAGSEIQRTLHMTALRTKQIVSFLLNQSNPTILISYERLLLDPVRGFSEIAEFLIGDQLVETAQHASQFVKTSADMPSQINFLDLAISLRRTNQQLSTLRQ